MKQSQASDTLMSNRNSRLIDKILKWVSETDRTSLWGLIIANLLPVVLCLLFGWEIGSLVMFYWFENLVIGFYSILRILAARDTQEPTTFLIQGLKNAFLAGFYTVHYFGFCLGHGIFLLLISSMDFGGSLAFADSPFDGNLFVNFWNAIPTGGLLSIAALFISHGISYLRNYIHGGEYLKTSASDEMFRPYTRIMLLHVCIIFGMMLVMMLGSQTYLVVLFVLAKTTLDAIVHSFSHRKKDE